MGGGKLPSDNLHLYTVRTVTKEPYNLHHINGMVGSTNLYNYYPPFASLILYSQEPLAQSLTGVIVSLALLLVNP